MFVRNLLSLLWIPFVLSEPDLCTNPKLDSIAYLTGQDMWFFTSGGYFWYIKEKDFPPGAPYGKLPDGFNRGDAAFYTDWIKVCPTARRASRQTRYRIKTSEQLVVVVEKGDDGNRIIEFDARTKKWSTSRSWDDDPIVGHSKIEVPNGQIDAIFSIRDSEVYVVQNQKFAGVDFKGLCANPTTGTSKQFAAQNVDSLANSLDVPFDAITVKNNDMYYFIGSKFWVSNVETPRTKDGKVVISRGPQQDVSSQFFKFKECAQNVVNTTQSSQPNGENEVPNSGQHQNEEKEDSDSEGSGGIFLVVLIIVVLVVVVLVIGGIVFAMTIKSEPQKGAQTLAQSPKSRAVKAPKASPAVPSKK